MACMKPSRFIDFVRDAKGHLPFAVYPAFPIANAIRRGTDCGDTCECTDVCLNLSHTLFDHDDPEYMLVVPESRADVYDLPAHWLTTITYVHKVSMTWGIVSDSVLTSLLHEKDPIACIWAYDTGPRPYCQHGGDEDWTVVVRKSVYTDDVLRFDCLDCCGISQEEEGDFVVYTGSHA